MDMEDENEVKAFSLALNFTLNPNRFALFIFGEDDTLDVISNVNPAEQLVDFLKEYIGKYEHQLKNQKPN